MAVREPRQRHHVADELVELLGLALDPREIGLRGLLSAPLRERERHADPRERRAQLVRDVAQQRLLVGHERLDPLGHRVEVARERADLVLAACERPADARVERAGRERAARLLQPHDRRGQIAREQQRRRRDREQRDAETATCVPGHIKSAEERHGRAHEQQPILLVVRTNEVRA